MFIIKERYLEVPNFQSWTEGLYLVDTATYDKARQNSIPATGTKFDKVIEAINDYIADLAKEQIELAFQQAQRKLTTCTSALKRASRPPRTTANR